MDFWDVLQDTELMNAKALASDMCFAATACSDCNACGRLVCSRCGLDDRTSSGSVDITSDDDVAIDSAEPQRSDIEADCDESYDAASSSAARAKRL